MSSPSTTRQGKSLLGQIGGPPLDRDQAHVEARENSSQHPDRQDRLQMRQRLEDSILLASPADACQHLAKHALERTGGAGRALPVRALLARIPQPSLRCCSMTALVARPRLGASRRVDVRRAAHATPPGGPGRDFHLQVALARAGRTCRRPSVNCRSAMAANDGRLVMSTMVISALERERGRGRAPRSLA